MVKLPHQNTSKCWDSFSYGVAKNRRHSEICSSGQRMLYIPPTVIFFQRSESHTLLVQNVQSDPQADANSLTYECEGVGSLCDTYVAFDGRIQEAMSVCVLDLVITDRPTRSQCMRGKRCPLHFAKHKSTRDDIRVAGRSVVGSGIPSLSTAPKRSIRFA